MSDNEYCERCHNWIPLGYYSDGSWDPELDRYIYLCEWCHKDWVKENGYDE